MRRLCGALLLCSSLGLVGVTHPTPSPKPIPTPSRKALSTPTLPPLALPTVVIYPFDTPKDMDQRAGEGIATIFSQIFTNSGGVTVLPVGKGVTRENFQKFALANHADYYISGYVQPIGSAAAVVAQLVSVDTGTSVYAQTTQISSVQDVGSEALTFHSVLETIEAQSHPELQTQGTPTPAPQASNGASMALGGITGAVESIFKGRGKATPTPTSTPVVKPPRGVLVARLSGNATAGDLTVGTNALLASMDTHFNAKMATIAPAVVAKSTDAICGTNRNNTVASGTLNSHRDGSGFAGHNVYDFKLTVYACFGAPIFTVTQSDRNLAKAIDAAVTAYVTDHAENS